jgi:hypothetical protein
VRFIKGVLLGEGATEDDDAPGVELVRVWEWSGSEGSTGNLMAGSFGLNNLIITVKELLII